MADTANETLRDLLVRHQVSLQRASAQTRAEVVALLDRTEASIIEELRRRLDALGGRSDRRLEFLLDVLGEIRVNAVGGAFRHLRDELRDMVRHEAEFAAKSIEASSPVDLDVTVPPPGQLTSLVTTSPFQGRVLGEWARDFAAADVQRLEDTIRIGVVRGDTTDDIVRSVVGTRAQNGADGVLQISRNNATSVVRTAVNHFSNAAKQDTYKENQDVLSGEVFHATLDDRTTKICASLDGEVFKVGEGPIPPLHWNCRSVRVPVIGGRLIGNRPMKEATEKDLVREFKDAEDIDEPGSDRDSLPHGTKGAFDDFARRRTRELTGEAAAELTYPEFLRRQSRAFQEEVLGVTGARLFRDGGLDLRKFVNRRGDELTLKELARRNAEAFKKAGLDPEDFR